MYIRKTLARLLITAMIAGSFCFPVPAEEINVPVAEQSVVTEQTESSSESGFSGTVVIETESESDIEPETEARN